MGSAGGSEKLSLRASASQPLAREQAHWVLLCHLQASTTTQFLLLVTRYLIGLRGTYFLGPAPPREKEWWGCCR